MGRVFGILLLVASLWVGMEIFTEGVDGAFGGLFARKGEPAAASVPPTQRARKAVERAYDRSQDRLERVLEENAPD